MNHQGSSVKVTTYGYLPWPPGLAAAKEEPFSSGEEGFEDGSDRDDEEDKEEDNAEELDEESEQREEEENKAEP